MKGYEPPHARCYCVATAATVVGGLAAAGAAVYTATNQGGEAAYGSQIQPVEYENNVNIPDYDPMAGGKDYLALLPTLGAISKGITRRGIKRRDEVMPGSSQLMRKSAQNLLSMSRGQLPQDVVDQTNQIVAERSGGGFDASSPESFAGGVSQATGDFARSIGQNSQQIMQQALAAGPAWEQLADQFAYTPDEALGGAMDLLKTRYNYALQAGQLQLQIDQNQYAAALNYNRTVAMPNPAVAGARNDMALGVSNASSGFLTAINGLVKGLRTPTSGYSATGTPAAPAAPAPQPWGTATPIYG